MSVGVCEGGGKSWGSEGDTEARQWRGMKRGAGGVFGFCFSPQKELRALK